MKITKLYSAAVVVMAALTFASCNNKKFHINGNITEAKDSMLYLENISLDGPVAIDSVKLGEDGSLLSLIHISEPTRLASVSRMPSSA